MEILIIPVYYRNNKKSKAVISRHILQMAQDEISYSENPSYTSLKNHESKFFRPIHEQDLFSRQFSHMSMHRQGSVSSGTSLEQVKTILTTESECPSEIDIRDSYCNFPCRNVKLLKTQRNVLDLKNFKDIDAMKHVDKLLQSSMIIPNERSLNFDTIIENLIRKMCEGVNKSPKENPEEEEDPETIVRDIANKLFTVDEFFDLGSSNSKKGADIENDIQSL